MESSDWIFGGTVHVRKTPFKIILPILAASAIGWILFIVSFGYYEHQLRIDNAYSGDFVLILYFPHWLLIFVTPLALALLGVYAVNGNYILGMIAQAAGIGCATTLGAVLLIYVATTHKSSQPFLSYFSVGLSGSLVLFLSLVAMLGAVPFLLSRYHFHLDQGSSDITQSLPSASVPIMNIPESHPTPQEGIFMNFDLTSCPAYVPTTTPGSNCVDVEKNREYEVVI